MKIVALVIVTVLIGLLVVESVRDRIDRIENIAPRGQEAENRVAEIARAIRCDRHEELRTVGVRPAVGHGQNARTGEFQGGLNSSSNCSRTAGAVAVGIRRPGS